jgi:hypothetical protein
VKTNSFEVFNKNQLEISPFSSVRLDFEFVFTIEQLVIYKEGNSIPALASNVQIQQPPLYKIGEIVLHNMGQTRLTLEPRTLVGQLEICNLQSRHTYLPISVRNEAFLNFANHTEAIQRYNIRFDLSERISNLLNMRNSKSHQDELAGLDTNVQRQIYVTRLVKQAKVDPINLPRNKKNKLLLNFDDLLNKLNSI